MGPTQERHHVCSVGVSDLLYGSDWCPRTRSDSPAGLLMGVKVYLQAAVVLCWASVVFALRI